MGQQSKQSQEARDVLHHLLVESIHFDCVGDGSGVHGFEIGNDYLKYFSDHRQNFEICKIFFIKISNIRSSNYSFPRASVGMQ
jgi:hypothetical protein